MQLKNKSRLLWMPLLVLLVCAAGKQRSDREIRVLIGPVDPTVVFAGDDLKMSAPKKKILKASQIELEPKAGKLLLKGREVGVPVKISGAGPIQVNGKSYPGVIEIVKDGDRLLLVNQVDIEDYLEGVIKNEMSVKWPVDALKAQTVLARTYALRKRDTPRADSYDLAATVDDQVYSGWSDKDPASQRAIKETEGEVLYYNGAPAEVFYHSCCGGQTESAEYVWGSVSRPYLQSVKCGACEQCPYYFWRFPDTGTVSPEELATKLGYQGEAVDEVSISESSPSQRALKLKVSFKGGHSTEITGADFRVRLGRDGVRSTFFRVEKDTDGFIIYGSGSGHGVGLCQWGAKGMAESDKDYKEILEHYFPGTDIKKIY